MSPYEDRRVQELMLLLEEYATISVGATIEDALTALDKAQLGLTYDRHHHRAILALDERGRVVGKLTYWSILRTLRPGLLGRDDISSLERTGLSEQLLGSLVDQAASLDLGLEAMCRAAARVRVRDAMVQAGETIDEEATLSEAIAAMLGSRAQSLLVTRGGEVVGILRLSDVFEEVADMIRGGRCVEP